MISLSLAASHLTPSPGLVTLLMVVTLVTSGDEILCLHNIDILFIYQECEKYFLPAVKII